MEKLKNKILNLTLKEKIIYTILFSLVLLLINWGFSKNNTIDSINSYTSYLDYETLTYDELMSGFNESYRRRDAYLIINNIIEDMKSNYQNNHDTFNDYYVCLDPIYSKEISKNTFSKKMEAIFDNIINSNSEYKIRMYSEQYYSSVFIAELYNEDVSFGKIGFILDYDNLVYSIFWVE